MPPVQKISDLPAASLSTEDKAEELVEQMPDHMPNVRDEADKRLVERMPKKAQFSEARVPTKLILQAIQNSLSFSQSQEFKFGHCLPDYRLAAPGSTEERCPLLLREKIAYGLPPEETLHFIYDRETAARRWDLAGGKHIRLTLCGDMGSQSFAGFQYLMQAGCAVMFWPDFLHLMVRREQQARAQVPVLQRAIHRLIITAKATRGPFHSGKNGSMLLEARNRFLEYCEKHPGNELLSTQRNCKTFVKFMYDLFCK